MVGVRVRLEHAHELHAAPLAFLEVLLDRERRVDDRGDMRMLVADEIRRAAEIVVDELREQHAATLLPPSAIYLEVQAAPSPPAGAARRTSRSRAGRPASARRSSGCRRGSGRASATDPRAAAHGRRTDRTAGSRR